MIEVVVHIQHTGVLGGGEVERPMQFQCRKIPLGPLLIVQSQQLPLISGRASTRGRGL